MESDYANQSGRNQVPLSIHWYGIIIGLGIALALYFAIRESEKHGLDKDTFADLLIWAIPIAIIQRGFIM